MIGDDNPQVVWLNVTLFANKDKFAELIAIDKDIDWEDINRKGNTLHIYPTPVKYTTALIETLVHESRHVVQYQAKMDCATDPTDNQKKYIRRLKEIEARRAANEYVKNYITEEDRKWARAIIARAVKQEHTNEKKFRSDAQ